MNLAEVAAAAQRRRVGPCPTRQRRQWRACWHSQLLQRDTQSRGRVGDTTRESGRQGGCTALQAEVWEASQGVCSTNKIPCACSYLLLMTSTHLRRRAIQPWGNKRAGQQIARCRNRRRCLRCWVHSPCAWWSLAGAVRRS